jgi:hypothetical protein
MPENQINPKLLDLKQMNRLNMARTSLGIGSRASSGDSTERKFTMNPSFITQTFYRPNENFMSNVTARFIEQKSKYFPSYLKQTRKPKISISCTEIDTVLGRFLS